VTFLTDSNMVI